MDEAFTLYISFIYNYLCISVIFLQLIVSYKFYLSYLHLLEQNLDYLLDLFKKLMKIIKIGIKHWIYFSIRAQFSSSVLKKMNRYKLF